MTAALQPEVLGEVADGVVLAFTIGSDLEDGTPGAVLSFCDGRDYAALSLHGPVLLPTAREGNQAMFAVKRSELALTRAAIVALLDCVDALLARDGVA